MLLLHTLLDWWQNLKGLDQDNCAENATNQSYNKITIHCIISIYMVIQFFVWLEGFLPITVLVLVMTFAYQKR